MGRSMGEIWETLYSTTIDVTKKENCWVLWQEPILYSQTFKNVVLRGFKLIIGFDKFESKDQMTQKADKIKREIQRVLNDPDNYVCKEKPHPFKLKIKTINVIGGINISKHKIAVSQKLVKNQIFELYNSFYQIEMMRLTNKLDSKYAQTNIINAEINALKLQRNQDFDIMSNYLRDNVEYKATFYKSYAKLYQMTYYDSEENHRHKEGVGDIVIALGADRVNDNPRYTNPRSDSIWLQPDVLPKSISYFKITAIDKEAEKGKEKLHKVGR